MHLWVVSACLKLLPPKELEQLDIPVHDGSPVPAIDVNYITENDNSILRDKTSQSRQSTEATRFNLFTGYQTLDQREKSFQVIINSSLISLLP